LEVLELRPLILASGTGEQIQREREMSIHTERDEHTERESDETTQNDEHTEREGDEHIDTMGVAQPKP
jgi:hypothetical protein